MSIILLILIDWQDVIKFAVNLLKLLTFDYLKLFYRKLNVQTFI